MSIGLLFPACLSVEHSKVFSDMQSAAARSNAVPLSLTFEAV